MKKLIAIINPLGKTLEQIKKESKAALEKYRKASSQKVHEKKEK